VKITIKITTITIIKNQMM